MIERLLPATAASAETRGELPGAELFPEEEGALGAPVEKRRVEFVTGRACARRALRELGIPPAPITSGGRGEPVWPEGVVGSITHCPGYTACAVARERDLLALGIDAEPNAELPAGVLPSIAFGDERELRLSERGVHADRLLFSAKEAVYKAWFPLTGRQLAFEEVRVSFRSGGSRFVAALSMGAPPSPPLIDGVELAELHGRWSLCGGVILTAVAVPPHRDP
jgi:4'-phosphopantetheinyl transferase EntD